MHQSFADPLPESRSPDTTPEFGATIDPRYPVVRAPEPLADSDRHRPRHRQGDARAGRGIAGRARARQTPRTPQVAPPRPELARRRPLRARLSSPHLPLGNPVRAAGLRIAAVIAHPDLTLGVSVAPLAKRKGREPSIPSRSRVTSASAASSLPPSLSRALAVLARTPRGRFPPPPRCLEIHPGAVRRQHRVVDLDGDPCGDEPVAQVVVHPLEVPLHRGSITAAPPPS